MIKEKLAVTLTLPAHYSARLVQHDETTWNILVTEPGPLRVITKRLKRKAGKK